VEKQAITYSISEVKSYSKIDDFAMLLKIRLSTIVVLTSLIAFMIASNGVYSLTQLLLLALGGFLVTGSANTLNQVLEKDFDILMERTKNRPLAAGRMKISDAVLFAGLCCVIGVLILATFNPLTVLLSVLALISYAFIYTPLKRYSTSAVAVGAIPGALPVLIGFAAVDGSISALAFSLFVIQFLWQFPHFWSIGYLGFEDYNKAGYKLLPISDNKIDKNVGLYGMIYTLLIIPIAYFIFTINHSAVQFLITSILSLLFAYTSLNLHYKFDKKSALLVMFTSFFYMPFVLIVYWLI
jgi:protoheme IX farnesyltransferase